ncbi:hypothetical protein PM082_003714 [Marasmius tenuissimus]|nr:hypothetical protein PM082_003714 [Marasmius tenuissimus]
MSPSTLIEFMNLDIDSNAFWLSSARFLEHSGLRVPFPFDADVGAWRLQKSHFCKFKRRGRFEELANKSLPRDGKGIKQISQRAFLAGLSSIVKIISVMDRLRSYNTIISASAFGRHDSDSSSRHSAWFLYILE